MKFALLVFVFIISSFYSAHSQITFERNYDTLGFYYANCVKQTLDGGYVFCGSSYNSATANDAEIVKTDEYGNVIWAKRYGGPAIDGAITIEVTADSNYFVFGIKDQVSATQSDIWILKLDQNGDTIFTKNIDLGPGSNYVKGSTKTFDGGFALTGYTDSRGQGYNDVSLIKLNSFGDTSWIKTYGGSQNDNGYSISQNQDSGYIITGVTGSFNVQIGDFYTIRTDVNGDTLWTRTFGFTNADFAVSAKETSDGGFVVAGTSWDTIAGNYDIYLIKYDSWGNLLWDKRLKQNYENSASGLEVLQDGRMAISGTIWDGIGYNAYLILTNDVGDTLWTKEYGKPYHSEQIYSLSLTTDGGYILSGSTDTITQVGYLVKVDSLGSLLNTVPSVTQNFSYILYPNPTAGSIHLDYNSENNSKIFSFRIYDALGNLVKVGQLKDQQNEIDLFGITPGMYFISLFTNEKSLQTLKFILTP